MPPDPPFETPLSRLESLVSLRNSNSASLTIKLKSPGYDPLRPAHQILSFLSDSPTTIFALRQCSKTFNEWVQPLEPSLFKRIRFKYPPTEIAHYDTRSSSMLGLEYIKPYVSHLRLYIIPVHGISAHPTVSVLTYVVDIPTLERITITLCPELDEQPTIDGPFSTSHSDVASQFEASKHLWLPAKGLLTSKPTAHSSHHFPLIQLRETLESTCAKFKALTRITFTNLSVVGIESMRFGSVTSLTLGQMRDNQWMNAIFWEHIKRMEVCLVSWWDHEDNAFAATSKGTSKHHGVKHLFKGSAHHQRTGGRHHASKNAGISRQSDSEDDDDHERLRLGFNFLHSWLEGFTGTLESLQISWVKPVLTSRPLPQLADSKLSRRAILEQYPETRVKCIEWRFCAGRNPLLFDRQLNPSWFWRGMLVWERMEELKVLGCAMGGEDVAAMKVRGPKLKRFRVEMKRVEPGVQCTQVAEDENGCLVAEVALKEQVTAAGEILLPLRFKPK